jgi:hypothetical protein
MNPVVSMQLSQYLDRTVERILVDGTRAESRTLVAMAVAGRELRPGATAALIDWEGSEIARLRAFGIVHGVLVRDLPTSAQALLLSQLLAHPAHVSSDGARSHRVTAVSSAIPFGR